jgi:hypothetical protein
MACFIRIPEQAVASVCWLAEDELQVHPFQQGACPSQLRSSFCSLVLSSVSCASLLGLIPLPLMQFYNDFDAVHHVACPWPQLAGSNLKSPFAAIRIQPFSKVSLPTFIWMSFVEFFL